MKKSLLLAALLLAGCATPVTRAPWRSYSGALRYNQCDVYAKTAQADLLCRGIDAYYVIYGWNSGTRTGRHAVVIFQDSKGWWLVDNCGAWPMRVRGKTVMEMVKSYDRAAYVVWETSGCPVLTDWF